MVVFEATGRYDRVIQACLENTGTAYARINPLRAGQFARSRDCSPRPTNWMLAFYAQWDWRCVPNRQRLYDLQARREDVVGMFAAEQNRLAVADGHFIVRDLKASLLSLMKRRDALQKQINLHIDAHQDLKQQNRQLQTVPGVGSQTACRLMASMPELGYVNRR